MIRRVGQLSNARGLMATVAVVCILLAVLLVPGGARGGDTAPESQTSASVLREIPERRTSNSRTYLRSEGTFVSRFFTDSVNYEDAKGNWQEIDGDLMRVAGGYVNRANRYRLTLPDDVDRPVRVAEGSAWIEYQLLGAKATATVEGNRARYPRASPGVDLTYVAGTNSVKEEITLASLDSQRTFRFRLSVSPGLKAQKRRNGQVDIVNEDGEAKFSLAPPVMWDSSNARRVTDRIAVELEADGTAYALEIRPSQAWLEDSRRVWPVVLDPTVTLRGAERDCAIREAQVTDCGSAWLEVGQREDQIDPDCYEECITTVNRYRGLLRFDLGNAMPTDALVQQAKLGVYSDGLDGTLAPLDASALTRAWTNGVSWATFDGVGAWTTPGGDTEQTPAASANVGLIGWAYLYPTALVQRWLAGVTPNNGLLLTLEQALVSKFFRSSDYSAWYGTTSTNPYLEVIWSDASPVETRIDAGPNGTTGSRDAEFSFSSPTGATSFECSLEHGAWVACSSPHALSALASHYHSFRVRAKDGGGNVDPNPASRDWLVRARSPDGPSREPSISADGRYVAFRSAATDFTADDTNDRGDIVVYDIPESGAPQVMETVSVNSAGARADGGSSSPSISADGRYVAFRSHAWNLVSSDTNYAADVFVRDRVTRTTTSVSVASTGAQAYAASYSPSISADGRYVAFSSDASNLAANDTNAVEDVFVRDRTTNVTTRVSGGGAKGTTQANAVSSSPSISADGRYVAFESSASNLVAGDTNSSPDVFVRDRTGGKTTRVSVATSGGEAGAGSAKPSISGDGRYVAFESLAGFDWRDVNATSDIYVRDRTGGATTWASAGADPSNNGRSYSPSISRSGRYVSFASDAPLDPADSNGVRDVYEFDRSTGAGTQISQDAFLGRRGNAASDSPSTSDARRVAFASDASNFNACYPTYCDDNNLVEDVLIHEWVAGAGTAAGAEAGAAEASATSPGCAAWGAANPSIDAFGPAAPLAAGDEQCEVSPVVPRIGADAGGGDPDKPPPDPQGPQFEDPCEDWEEPAEGDRHHIATNKNLKRRGSLNEPWTPIFERMFRRGGLDLNDDANVVRVPNHKGSHDDLYHLAVYNRLQAAIDRLGPNPTKAQIAAALRQALSQLKRDVTDPNHDLNKMITKENPRCPQGPFIF